MYLLLSLLFVSVPDGNTNSSNENLLIEHSVTLESAENAIQHIVPELMIGVGCRECTIREIEYCLSNDAIEDHCCCQRKYHEVFPYIAHTCYVRSRNCEPTVRDCGVFDRLLTCCCHQYLGTKWKIKMAATVNGQSRKNNSLFLFGLIIFLIQNNYYIFNFL
ncbi:uncharacterized protein LOC107884715 [Acyrthosiphon pisum]|uniref:CCC domain-containing protein n=1 Tax=Acyrthosiphon pisum TaxID=7029 RepID=A0A8R2D5T3_ACYPI|nr:uncharacterized protein LOC107884715 [Acyrthosiphon pisum]|eukprot:XP_016662933.1 PREDICTED: uncharacterized protein LOC107884715 [Acyrthosiphon pisum]